MSRWGWIMQMGDVETKAEYTVLNCRQVVSKKRKNAKKLWTI